MAVDTGFAVVALYDRRGSTDISVDAGKPFGNQMTTVVALVNHCGCGCRPLKWLLDDHNNSTVKGMVLDVVKVFLLFVLLFPFGQLFPVLHWLFVSYPSASGPLRRWAQRRATRGFRYGVTDDTERNLKQAAGANVEKTLQELQSEKVNAMVSDPDRCCAARDRPRATIRLLLGAASGGRDWLRPLRRPWQ